MRAAQLDREDTLAPLREAFSIPLDAAGSPVAYLCGNSLGLQPTAARSRVEQELEDWARLGVRGHLEARTPWYSYHERVRDALARVVGAQSSEVVAMNGLTTNLHLMMVSFYRPHGERRAILVEAPTFSSDRYAVETQIRFHGGDPERDRIEVTPRAHEQLVRDEDILDAIDRHGDRVALVLISGVSFLTGQRFDLKAITQAGHRKGCAVGFDLAHAAGNVPLALHDWGADFAVWCSYKYLNAGPGAVAGAFVHERHHAASLPRFGGWWGNDPDTRFKLQLEPEFRPVHSADAWQLSNPPILAMAPLAASLDLFDRAGMDALRRKSMQLTGLLEEAVRELPGPNVEVITPSDPERRGCQLSLRFGPDARAVQARLEEAGIIADFREPDVIRVAPAPLYNRFSDVARFARVVAALRAPAGANE